MGWSDDDDDATDDAAAASGGFYSADRSSTADSSSAYRDQRCKICLWSRSGDGDSNQSLKPGAITINLHSISVFLGAGRAGGGGQA